MRNKNIIINAYEKREHLWLRGHVFILSQYNNSGYDSFTFVYYHHGMNYGVVQNIILQIVSGLRIIYTISDDNIWEFMAE